MEWFDIWLRVIMTSFLLIVTMLIQCKIANHKSWSLNIRALWGFVFVVACFYLATGLIGLIWSY